MSTELIINASLPETRIALMENGEIQDLVIERPSGKGVAGNIYKGRVTRVLPGMQAAFVDIGLEKAAFLYVDDVFVHSDIWEAEEGGTDMGDSAESVEPASSEGAVVASEPGAQDVPQPAARQISGADTGEASPGGVAEDTESAEAENLRAQQETEAAESLAQDFLDEAESEDEGESDDDDHGPVGMGQDPEDRSESGPPEGTVAPDHGDSEPSSSSGGGARNDDANEIPNQDAPASEAQAASAAEGGDRGDRFRRGRRGRRGGRYRRNRERQQGVPGNQNSAEQSSTDYPENYVEQVADTGEELDSDRSSMANQTETGSAPADRPAESTQQPQPQTTIQPAGRRPEFREPRSRDRRIKPKIQKSVRGQVNIQDLLKEGQEVIVQVAKEPIATKGARLTCHISLPGRHLVCMPTIDHVGVSRRIERDDERRKLREHVERYRPKNLGFIVRTASGRQQSEKRIKQDIDYLARLWTEIREKAGEVTAPALVYEDLNPILRAIRDWVTEDIDKIIVDSRYHFNEIQRFVAHFMPSLRQKIELYHGDVPIFDAYGLSTELARALERKVWLKSGGYLVIDQAEALVAIDVNTGRFVGKKNLEDTILKTNLEAVEEIAYQLRLRNAGGIIILDLIDMEKEENKHRVYRALEEALKKDRARPTIMKISDLGLVEMTRKRTRDTMVRTLCESCPACEGKGYLKSKQTVAFEVLRELEREGAERDIGKILVQAHPDVIDALAIDERETLDHIERRYRKQIYLQAAPDFHVEQFEVVGDKGPRSEKAREQGSDYRADYRGDHRGDHRDRDRGRGGRDRDRDRNRDRDRDQRDRGRDQRDRDRDQKDRPRIVIQPVQTPVATSGPTVSVTTAPAEGGGQGEQQEQQPSFAPEGTSGSDQANGNAMPVARPQPDHDMTEEDRLAFLRAQAAQDAALARYHGQQGAQGGNAGLGRGSVQGRSQGQGGRDGGDRDRNSRKRRGRRGGRFRRDNRRQNGQALGQTNEGTGVSSSASSDSGNKSGGEGGGAGGSGGGSDHSQPPV